MPKADDPAGKPADANQSLARGLTILRRIADSDGELGIRELARALEIDKSIVSRLVHTLASHGFLEQNPATRRYRIGPSAFQVGRNNSQISRLHNAAYDELLSLSRKHRVNAYLGVRSQTEVLYVCAIQTEQASVLRVNTGVRGNLHTTSLGKILLAAMPDAALTELLGQLRFSRLTPYTITAPETLLEQVMQVRQRGYAVSDEENLVDIISVGAPIRDASGKVIAAVSMAVHKEVEAAVALDDLIRITERAGGIISNRLGAVPGAPFDDLTTAD